MSGLRGRSSRSPIFVTLNTDVGGTIPRSAVALRVSGPWWNSFLSGSSSRTEPVALSTEAETLSSNICPRFSAVCGGALIALCLNQGVGLPRLCGTPCRWIEVSHSLRLRVNPLRHAAAVLAVSTDPWLTCICFWACSAPTAPSVPGGKPLYAH